MFIFDFKYLIESLLIVIKAVPTTLKVSIVSMCISLVIGTIAGVIRYQKIPILEKIVSVYVSIFRSTPNIAQIFLFYYGIGQFSQIVNQMDPLVAAVIVLSCNAGAYITESIRGGLLSVSEGQIEAGKALALPQSIIMRRIILPQAFPIALPALFNNYVDIIKGTSITFMIGVPDIMGVARTEGSLSFRYLEIYMAVTIVYWFLVNGFQLFFSFIERKIQFER